MPILLRYLQGPRITYESNRDVIVIGTREKSNSDIVDCAEYEKFFFFQIFRFSFCLTSVRPTVA